MMDACDLMLYDHFVSVSRRGVVIANLVDNTHELLKKRYGCQLLTHFNFPKRCLKKFAGWAAIIAVPTMVAGFYGMNFKFMPGLNWHYGFFVVIIITLGICVTLYFFFNRSEVMNRK